jgi:hypothetical protein
MSGSIVYAEVPHRPYGWPLATWPLCFAGNAAIFALVGAAVATARVRWEPSADVPALAHTSGPVVFLSWHRTNYASTPALRRLPEGVRPTLVMHDGLASRALTHQSSAWLGFETFVYRRRSPVSPREQIATYVRESGCSVVVLPDAGGPYGRVKPGMLRVAAQCGAWLQPFGVRVRGAVVVGGPLRHVVPLPGASIRLRWGEPLAPGTTVEQCQAAMDALDDAP